MHRGICPQQGAEILKAGFVERVPRQHGQPALPREISKALRISRPAFEAIPVHVEAAGHAAVGAAREEMRIGGGFFREQLREGPQRAQLGVIVDVREHEYVGRMADDNVTRGNHLGVSSLDVAQEKARALAGEFGIEEGDTQLTRRQGGRWRGCDQGQEQGEKGGCKQARKAQTEAARTPFFWASE